MKNIRRLFVMVTLGAVLVPSIAWAAPADAPAGSTIEQRIQLRKKEQKIKLTQKEQIRYKSRCVNTQNAVRDIQSKLGTVMKTREDIYGKIDAKLWIIIGELKLAGQDTFKLETQRTEYAKKVTAYINTLNQYNQTLDDIVVMNCQADLAGFIALVKTAREYHTSLRTQSDDINTYIVNTIKKTLSDFTTALQPKNTEQ